MTDKISYRIGIMRLFLFILCFPLWILASGFGHLVDLIRKSSGRKIGWGGWEYLPASFEYPQIFEFEWLLSSDPIWELKRIISCDEKYEIRHYKEKKGN